MHMLLLAREMAALEYRTVLVAGSCEPEDGDMSYLLRAADSVRWVPELSRSVRPWRNLKALWRLWRLLRCERPAIVHTHTAMAGCLGRLAAVLSGVPIVIHTFHGNSLNEYFSRFQAGVFRCVERLLACFTDALCVLSPQQATELSAKFHIAPARKFRIVPLGLDLDDYFALDPPQGSGPLTVGWFGRMVPVKNIALLAATIENTLQRGQDIQFVIAGDGPDRALLNGPLARYGGRVEWLGWQRDILPAVARCDVVLQTSRNEGTPVALIQGMAAARPFVSTAVGGVVDMVSGISERWPKAGCWYRAWDSRDAPSRRANTARKRWWQTWMPCTASCCGKRNWGQSSGGIRERLDYRRGRVYWIASGGALSGGGVARCRARRSFNGRI
jgi:glycosyltransferase involved in cell wall biosynthesis